MGLVENYFEGWLCTELLSGEEEMEQELDSPHLREKEVGRVQLMAISGGLGLAALLVTLCMNSNLNG